MNLPNGRLSAGHYSLKFENIKDMKFILEPYNSIGNVKFGMSIAEVKELIEDNPISEDKDFRGRKHLLWKDFSILFNKKDQVEEVTFSLGYNNEIIWNNIDILNDAQIVKKLNKIENVPLTLDSRVYFSIGIALIGKGKDRVVSVFSKSCGKRWKKLIQQTITRTSIATNGD